MNAHHVAPGRTITVSGGNCAPNTQVTVDLGGHVIASARTDTGGAFTVPVTIPEHTSSGAQRLLVTGQGCAATTKVTVERVEREGGSGFFGSWGATLVWIAVVALISGAALLIGARRRVVVRARRESSVA